MKLRLWIACAGLAGGASIFLALAGLGTAASPNICPTDASAPACIVESASPHFLTGVAAGTAPALWPQAVSTTRFTNQSGLSGATATHTKLSVKFGGTPIAANAPLVNIVDVKTIRPDGTAVPSMCATAVTSSVTVTCAVGSTAGGQTVKLVVRFGAATNITLDGDVTYGESGNDNPSGPNGTGNDNHSNSDFVLVGGMQQGSCFDLDGTTPVTVSGSDGATQATTATVGRTGIAGLPCTPAAAGVLKAIKSGTGQNVPGSFTRDISFTDFLSISNNGTATVVVDFLTSLPKAFKLMELLPGTDPAMLSSWVEVKGCPLAKTDPSPDTCISGTKNLPKSGLRYSLSAFGTFDDSKYSG